MNHNDVVPGLLTGISSAIIFNPIDKIIFCCCIQNKKLTDWSIWKNPFRGCFNSIGTRVITSGLYFALIDGYSDDNSNKAIGAISTAMVSSITNPIQLIKFYGWYHNCDSLTSIRFHFHKYGMQWFRFGIIPLITRDFIFNYIYLTHKKKDCHIHNLMVISGALAIASPFNLIKNKRYATKESLKSIISNFKFSQLGIGMTIGRSCISFYVSQIIYNEIKRVYCVAFN